MTWPTVEALTAPAGSGRRRRLRAAAVLVAVLGIGIGAVFGARIGEDAALVDSPLIGQPAPGWRLPNLEGGGELSLDELRGQIVVVNFWASWCVACREEHPALLGAASAFLGDGVTFVGIDYQDQRASAIGFLNEMGRGGENYRYVSDPGSRAAVDFGVFGVPETFFIDRSGTVVAKVTGASTYPLLVGVLDAIIAGRQPESRTNGPVQPAPPTNPAGG